MPMPKKRSNRKRYPKNWKQQATVCKEKAQWQSETCKEAHLKLKVSSFFTDHDDRGEAIVIPIILRPVYWQGAPFAKLQALPTGAKPYYQFYLAQFG
jgi:hypothetical protein